jgi:class 3 adenylate cyclase
MVERRKTVTVLFCDVVGSTALGESTDPEVLRAILARYFERMRAIVEVHRGTVEKFIGDAVMAVLGVPVAHEDDALRACRAAMEMREAFAGLGIEGRIGVSTGEVVTGTEERLATGDAVNVAARLQQAAAPGEVLLADATLTLAAEAVDVEAVEPLALKGKSEPLLAYRLLAARPASERRHETVFVGRERELALLREAWARTLAERGCELVTIVGDAGLGKSRLAAEALSSTGAPVVRGRCLPYGAGITYWPVVEVVKQLDALPSDPAAAAAIRSLLGESEAGTSAEEIAWAFRKLLEEQAPLVVLFDDIQWGEETFLDLVEHVALLSTGSPILLLCMARPELAGRRSEWPVAVPLGPLRDDDVVQLIGTRLPPELRDAIRRAASGNPLFVSEMLTMAADSDGEVRVPPTLRALLAARLDQLEPAERQILELGAIEGEVFHLGGVRALGPEGSQVTPRLAALLRKQLIRPDKPQLPGEDGFRFRHLLIRDAAYESLPKSVRAELHERFADWLEQSATELVALDELAGYHLEQAHRYRHELGQNAPELRQRAARHLGAAAERALARLDNPAVVNLLRRTLALLPDGIHLEHRLDLTDSLGQIGNTRGAIEALTEARERARLAGDRVAEGVASLRACVIRSSLDRAALAGLASVLDEVESVIEASGDERARLELLRAKFFYDIARAQFDAATRDAVAIVELARRTRRPHLAARHLLGRFYFLASGSVPISTVRVELASLAPSDRALLQQWPGPLAQLAATSGDFREARRLLDQFTSSLTADGQRSLATAFDADLGARIDLLAGDVVSADRRARTGIEAFAAAGEAGSCGDLYCIRAQALMLLGDLAAAEECVAGARATWSPGDVMLDMQWRRALACLKSLHAEHDGAEDLAREALAVALETEAPLEQAEAYACLAEVLVRAGKTKEASEHRDRALELCDRKEAPAYAAYFKRRLDAVVRVSA